MKKYILILVSIVIYNLSFSQDTIYFDKNWEKTKQRKAKYYRVVEQNTTNNNILVKDYFISGEIQMTGTYKTYALKDKDGIFTWYYKNGNIKNVSEYKDGTHIATKKEWNNKGNEIVNYYVLEQQPLFPGGETGLLKYIAENTKYPELARKNDVTGKVFIEFVINKRGKVKDVKVTRGAHPVLDREALRVIKSLPKWKPGMQKGKPVNVSYQVPINFTLY